MSRLAVDVDLPEGELAELAAGYRSAVAGNIAATDIRNSGVGARELEAQRDELEAPYQLLKGRLLRAASAATVGPRRLTTVLDPFCALRRAADQANKAAAHYRALLRLHGPAERHPPGDSAAVQ